MLTPETKMKRLLIILGCLLAWAGFASGIPEPYNLVYGVLSWVVAELEVSRLMW